MAYVSVVKIYTRTGDSGGTSLFSGERISKSCLRVDAYGTLDELNSFLGLARASEPAGEVAVLLEAVQNQLFIAGADLATSLGASRKITRIESTQVEWLEREIDRMTAQLPELRNFILPGGTPAAAQIHVARAVCRRGERQVVSLLDNFEINGDLLVYLNRLSDFLFTLARYENFLKAIPEEKWSIRAD